LGQEQGTGTGVTGHSEDPEVRCNPQKGIEALRSRTPCDGGTLEIEAIDGYQGQRGAPVTHIGGVGGACDEYDGSERWTGRKAPRDCECGERAPRRTRPDDRRPRSTR
jgi:hypothetical protein